MDIRDASWLVIDTETTGVDTRTCHIVELGAVPFDLGRPGQRMGTLINPGVPIPPESSAVHGIYDADVEGAPTLMDVDERFLEHVRAADVLVGYNILHYDEPLLRRSIGPRWSESIAGKPIIDPLVMVRLDSVGRWWKGAGRHRLANVAERMGVPVPQNAHRATADCVMTGLLLWQLLLHKGTRSLPRDAHELDGVLRVKAAEQEAEFRAYRGRKAGAA